MTEIIKTPLKDIPELVLKYKELHNIAEFIVPRSEVEKSNKYNEMSKHDANSFLQSTVEKIFQSFSKESDEPKASKGRS